MDIGWARQNHRTQWDSGRINDAMTKVYIFGPIDSIQPDGWDKKRTLLSVALYESGFDVYDPAIANPFDLNNPTRLIEFNEEMMKASDVLVGLYHPMSAGSNQEIGAARALGIPVVAVDSEAFAGPSPYAKRTDIHWCGDFTDAIAAVINISHQEGRTTGRLLWTPAYDGALDDGARAPTKSYSGDAGYDLYVKSSIDIPSHMTMNIFTGIKVELPSGYWGLLIARSSTIHRLNLRVQTAVIDNGYRGELSTMVSNDNPYSVFVEKGERLAQLILMPLADLTVAQVPALSKSERGEKGYGSSGR